MKFYSFVLFGVLCALSSMTHAKDEWRVTNKVVKNYFCGPGRRPVELRLCPEDARGLRGCYRNTRIKCVQVKSKPREKPTTTPPLEMRMGTDKLVRHTTCPPGQQLVKERVCDKREEGKIRRCYNEFREKCIRLEDYLEKSKPSEKPTTTPVPATKETGKVIKGVVCSLAKLSVKMRVCPEGAHEPQDCWVGGKFECVLEDQVTSKPREKLTPTPEPVSATVRRVMRKWKEYDIIKGATCPPGKKAVQEYTCRRDSDTPRACDRVQGFACVPDDEVNSHLGRDLSGKPYPYGRGSHTWTFVDETGRRRFWRVQLPSTYNSRYTGVASLTKCNIG